MAVKLIRGVFTPPPSQSVRVWAGLYGGHFDVLVLFKEKPVHRMAERPGYAVHTADGSCVDCVEEDKRGNVFATLGTGDFELWFPAAWAEIVRCGHVTKKQRPKHTEVRYSDLFEMELSLPVDENGEPIGLSYTEDR